MLQCIAVCVAVFCSVLQRVAARFSALLRDAGSHTRACQLGENKSVFRCSVFSVLQCVAECCSVSRHIGVMKQQVHAIIWGGYD